jgi:hypothetical protein
MSNQLPTADLAWVEELKIKEYLLNLAHPKGGPKAKFFQNCGFTAKEWEGFHDALVVQGKSNPVVKVAPNEFGTRYVVECNCPTPDELNPCIRTVWELMENETQPRLITAHPLAIDS